MNPLLLDLETGSADDLFRAPTGEFVRLSGLLGTGDPVILTDHAGAVEAATDPGAMVIGHNVIGFDLVALARHHGLDLERMEGRVVDTMLAVRQMDPPPSGKDQRSMYPKGHYSLAECASRFGVPGKTDDLARLAKQYGGYDKIPTDNEEYRSYLDGDLRATQSLLGRLQGDAYLKREFSVALRTAQITLNGFQVDVGEVHRRLDEQAGRRSGNIQRLEDMLRSELPGKSPLASDVGKRAIEAYLLDHGVSADDIPRTAKTGKLATGRDALTEFTSSMIESDNPHAAGIVEMLEVVGHIVSERTVYQTIDKYRVGDRVHPKISATQASGRWSVTGPGLTVLGKRGGKHVEREVLIADHGCRILTVDLAQADARAVAAHSGDRSYIEIFLQGRDLHSEVSQSVFGKVSKELREIVKPISHGWSYGRSAKAMANAHGLDLELCRHFDREMRRSYPALVEWQAHVRDQATRGYLLDNGFGRRMRAHPWYAYTQAPALVGQGCTRDMIAEGLIRLPWDVVRMIKTIVHDEIVFSIPTDVFDDVKAVIVDAMTFDLADVTGGALAHVPVVADAGKAAPTWGAAYAK